MMFLGTTIHDNITTMTRHLCTFKLCYKSVYRIEHLGEGEDKIVELCAIEGKGEHCEK